MALRLRAPASCYSWPMLKVIFDRIASADAFQNIDTEFLVDRCEIEKTLETE